MTQQDLTNQIAGLQSRSLSLLGRVREYSAPRRITELASRLSFFSSDVLFATGVSSVAFGAFVGIMRFTDILDKYTTAALLAPIVVLCASAWSLLAYRYKESRPIGSGIQRGIYVLDEEIRKAEANPRTPPTVIEQLYSMKTETIGLLRSEWQSTEKAMPRLSIKGE